MKISAKIATLVLVNMSYFGVAFGADYADRMFAFTQQTLRVGDRLFSQDGRYFATMQPDCNFVVYQNGVGGHAVAISSSRTVAADTSCHASMQRDGHFVIYGSNGSVRFRSLTAGNPNAVLVMQADGNLVIYSDYSLQSALWSSFQKLHRERP